MRAVLRLPKAILIWALLAGVSVAAVVIAFRVFVPEVTRVRAISFRDIAGVRNDTHIDLGPLDQRSYIFDKNGRQLAVLIGDQNREIVTLDKITPTAQAAVISAEDKNFYLHTGFDLRGALRAAAVDITGGGIAQGGSTISQQVIKNSNYGSTEQKLRRKVQEALLAHRLEQQLTDEGKKNGTKDPLYAKHQILTRYLNTVYLGNGAYGIEAGAEVYFNHPAAELTLPEAAMLAGVIRSPNANDPVTHPDQAKIRRAEVLDRMLADGKITQKQRDAADETPLPTKLFLQSQFTQGGQADYFAEQAKRTLLDLDNHEYDAALGDTPTARYNAVFKGGLRITTTFDPHLQEIATAAVNDTLPEDVAPYTAAMTAIDSQTGAVRAFVSGKGFDFASHQFILPTQAERSTGSSFKAITLTTALSNGYSPYDQVDGRSPCILGYQAKNPPPRSEWFHNAEGGGGSILDLRQATWGSVNCAYLHLAEELTPQKISDKAQEMGFGTVSGLAPQQRDESCPCESITLGAVNASTLDMASAMQTLAADGKHYKAYFIEKIEGAGGKVLYKHDDPGRQVVDANVALTVQDILTGVIDFGTGTAAQLADGRVAAGKTGTDNDFKNAEFVGFTKHYSVAVWMGNPDNNNDEMRDVGGITVFGGTYPARIFKAFMDPAHEGIPVEADNFDAPDYSVYRGGRKVGYFSKAPDPPRDTGPTTSAPPTSSSEPQPTTPTGPPPTGTTTPPATTGPPATEPPTTTKPEPTRPKESTTSSPPDTTVPPTTSPPTTVPPTTEPPTTTTSPPTSTSPPST